MYSTCSICPMAVLLFLSNFAVRPGHTFFNVLEIDVITGGMTFRVEKCVSVLKKERCREQKMLTARDF